MKRLLVTGAGGAAASNFVKSLRLSEEPMYIVGTDIQPYHLELAPIDKSYLVPPVSDEGYLERLNAIIRHERIDFLHPQPDPEVAFLSEHREEIATAHLLPAAETIRTCQDKIELTRILQAHGVPTAESFLLTSEQSLKDALDQLLAGGDRVWLRATKGAGARASLPVRRLEHARAWIDYWSEERGIGYGQFMASEFLPGREFAFQSLWYQGEIVTSQARERLHYLFGYLTPSGQTSSPSVARTVHRDDVNDIATRAVKTVDERATGIFCVDLKEDTDGIPNVTEINAGRFFTTSNFLTEAGCNMPYYYLGLALGQELPPLAKFNAVPENLYWVRMVDMGHKLVKGESWRSVAG